MKFLAMHITNQKLSFDIFTVGNLQNIFMEHYLYFNVLMIFGNKRKIYNFDPYNVFFAVATNIPQRLKTGFVVQGHKWKKYVNEEESNGWTDHLKCVQVTSLLMMEPHWDPNIWTI